MLAAIEQLIYYPVTELWVVGLRMMDSGIQAVFYRTPEMIRR